MSARRGQRRVVVCDRWVVVEDDYYFFFFLLLFFLLVVLVGFEGQRWAGDGDGVGLGGEDDARPGRRGHGDGVVARVEADLVAVGVGIGVGVAVGESVRAGIGRHGDLLGARGHLQRVVGHHGVEADVMALDSQRLEPEVEHPQRIGARRGPVRRGHRDPHRPKRQHLRLMARRVNVHVRRRDRHRSTRLSRCRGHRRELHRRPVGHPVLGLGRIESQIRPRQRQRAQRRVGLIGDALCPSAGRHQHRQHDQQRRDGCDGFAPPASARSAPPRRIRWAPAPVDRNDLCRHVHILLSSKHYLMHC